MRWGARPVTSRPRKRIRPESGRRAPAIRLKSVVLPEPLGPMTPSSSPSSSVKLTSLTAWTPPKPLDSRSTSRRGMSRVRAIRGSTLREGRRGIGERSRRRLLGPDQLLLAVDPLEERLLDDARAVGTEFDRSDDGVHAGGGHGVADLVTIERARAGHGGGHDLHAGVGRPHQRIGGTLILLLVRLVELAHAGALHRVVPARGQHHVVAVLAQV